MFSSQGLITINSTQSAHEIVAAIDPETDRDILFVPKHDYSIKHRDKRLAVFVGEQGEAFFLHIDNAQEGVKIKLKGVGHNNERDKQLLIHAIVRSAAMTRSIVEVVVERINQHGLKITGITPAK